ncbi:M28 family peptidase, partial [bacterium]
MASPVFIRPVSAQNEPSEEELRRQFATVLQSLDTERIKGHVQFFSSVSSRVTGYPGFFESVDYMVSKFSEYGIRPYGDNGTYFENYEVTVPVDHGASITLEDGTIIEGHNIWPNLVNPCPYVSPEAGDRLIYVGRGSFDDLESVNLTDRFVLMEFDSRWFFRLAAMFGAKGILYIGSEDATRMEAIQKLYACPVNLPRIYLTFEDGYRLRELCREYDEITISISSFMEWQKILVPNVLGFIPGTLTTNESAVISAYIDSWSIVPALAPGATDSLGISVLLEIARFLSQHRPTRSVILLGVSGHWEGLWGAREFVDRHFADIGRRIAFFAGMDLATGSGQLGVADLGSSYAYRNIEILNGRYSWLVAR